MTPQVQTPYLELQKQLWKARAQAKQKWLEQSLAQPTRTPDDAAWRVTWIKQALNVVKRGQDEIRYQTALMDAYTEHLNVLEMTLFAAVEEKRSPETAAPLSVETVERQRSIDAPAPRTVETAEQKRSPEAAAHLTVETGVGAGLRPGDSLKRKHA